MMMMMLAVIKPVYCELLLGINAFTVLSKLYKLQIMWKFEIQRKCYDNRMLIFVMIFVLYLIKF